MANELDNELLIFGDDQRLESLDGESMGARRRRPRIVEYNPPARKVPQYLRAVKQSRTMGPSTPQQMLTPAPEQVIFENGESSRFGIEPKRQDVKQSSASNMADVIKYS